MTDSDDSTDGFDLFLNNFCLNGISEEQNYEKESPKPVEFVTKIKSNRGLLTNSEKSFEKRTLNYKAKWKQVTSKLGQIQDPWGDFPDIQAKTVKRYRYDVDSKKWTLDSIKVKMEHKPFSRGSMRECYRMKCQTSSSKTWRNCVAKRYFDYATVDTYRNDVVMQHMAKKWSELYNRWNPPKKVDMVQLSMMETDDGFYHLEPFMIGNYVKYNSNCGFVDKCLRNTPQAFSHFTFEKSDHVLMVVDIQGVDDMYTDPQIHTHDGAGYGEGNLGVRGMALFFHSHVCSSICLALGLSQFAMTETELGSSGKIDSATLACHDLYRLEPNGINISTELPPSPVKSSYNHNCGDKIESDGETFILSKVHHQLALYHQMGRFVQNDSQIDWNAYDFHENVAASLDNPEAAENLAKIYLNLTTTHFDVNSARGSEDIRSLGHKYMLKCAEEFRLPFCVRYVAHQRLDERDWGGAAALLEELVVCGKQEFFEATQLHLFREKADLGRLYMTGGCGLEKNCMRAEKLLNEAANEALCMNYAEVAMNYFELAEQCLSGENLEGL